MRIPETLETLLRRLPTINLWRKRLDVGVLPAAVTLQHRFRFCYKVILFIFSTCLIFWHSSWSPVLSLACWDRICKWFWAFNVWRRVFISATFSTWFVAIFVFKNDCSSVYFDHVLGFFIFDWLKIYFCCKKFQKG